MISLKKWYAFMFFIGIFILPFNSQVPNWLGFLGEYSGESSPIFFFLAFIILIFHSILNGRLLIPLKSTEYSLFILFIIVACLVTLINLPSISNHYFKQTSGIQRFVRQLSSLLIIGVVFFLVFINICRNYGALKFFLLVRKTMLISFCIVFCCGLIEFFIINQHLDFLVPVIKIFNYLPYVEIKLDYRLGRVSSTTFEPPALGTYLITISGFMFSYILSSKKTLKYLPYLLVIVLAILTKSRTALVAIIIQTLVAIYFAYKTLPKFRNFFSKTVILGTAILFVAFIFNGKEIINSIEERIDGLNFAKNLKYNSSENAVSNKSRLGIQVAMFEVFKENPISGTGWGQQAFESRSHYPSWATTHNYEFKTKYLNEKIKSFPPGYNMYLRILTETGIVGFFIFSMFLYVIIKKALIVYKLKKTNSFIAIALIVSFSGYFLNWLQIDSFRLYGFWICLAILIILYKSRNDETYSINTSL